MRHDPDSVNAVAFSPDGLSMVQIPLGSERILDPFVFNEIVLSSDGLCLVGWGANTLRLLEFDISNPALDLVAHDPPLVIAHTFMSAGVRDVQFRPGEHAFAAIETSQSTDRVFLRNSIQLLWTVKFPPQSLRRLRFSPDGHKLAVQSRGADNTIHLLDAATGAAIRSYKVNPTVMCGLAFSPDNATVATGHADSTICLSDSNTGIVLCAVPVPWLLWDLTFSPDGKRLVWASMFEIGVSECTPPFHIKYVPVDGITAITSSPAGKLIATAHAIMADGKVAGGKEITFRSPETLEATGSFTFSADVLDVAFWPKTEFVVAATVKGVQIQVVW